MREGLRALDISVVIDVAMTETAREADYVLPASSQFEKAEASFFNFEAEANAFQLRHPLFPPREGTREEGAIHAALCEALGAFTEAEVAPLREAAARGLDALAMVFMQIMAANPALMPIASVLLYRALGPALPEGLANAAGLWGVSQLFVGNFAQEAARAGFAGPGAGNQLFAAILASPSGVVFARQEAKDSWQRLRTPGQQINLFIPEMIEALLALDPEGPPRDPDYPFILSAGKRRTETSNTAIRNPDWLRKGKLHSSLRIHPADAAALGLAEGDAVAIVTTRSRAEAVAELYAGSRRGRVSLPNGLGLDVAGPDGGVRRHGVARNELTDYRWRDPVVGTPWHKYVPARLERVG
jgi:anaerobic selenocysteine-containing dehydrogenase